MCNTNPLHKFHRGKLSVTIDLFFFFAPISISLNPVNTQIIPYIFTDTILVRCFSTPTQITTSLHQFISIPMNPFCITTGNIFPPQNSCHLLSLRTTKPLHYLSKLILSSAHVSPVLQRLLQISHVSTILQDSVSFTGIECLARYHYSFFYR